MRRQLIVVFGVPGVGKSTLAKELAGELHCFRFDKDFISDIFRKASRDTDDDRAMAYAIIEAAIRGSLDGADRIIVEAPLMKQLGYPAGKQYKHPEYFASLAEELGAELKLIQLWCDEKLLLGRIRERQLDRDASRRSEEGFRAFLAEEPLRLDEATRKQFDICEIDSCKPMSEQLSAALAHIHRRQRGPGNSLKGAWTASFAFKRPIRQGKRGSFSLALWLFALLFWLHRFVAPIQWVKFLARWRFLDRTRDPVPPLIAELFTLIPVLLLIVNLWCAEHGYAFIAMPFTLLWLLLCWQVFDVVMANLYYLMLRPIVDHDPPHNSYRSFILGWFGFLQLVLLLTTLWYYAALHSGLSGARVASIFGQILKGDAGVAELAKPFAALDLFSKATFGIMLTIILGRAISLVPPLPSDSQPHEGAGLPDGAPRP